MGRRYPAGKFDRHVEVQISAPTKDASNDTIENWEPWRRRWMEVRDRESFREISAPHEVVRDYDTVFVTRMDATSLQIAPESHRLYWKQRIWEIVGIARSVERQDCFLILGSSRPDGRGPRGPGNGSQP